METITIITLILASTLGYILYRKNKLSKLGFNTRMNTLIQTLNDASSGKRALSVIQGEGSSTSKKTSVNWNGEEIDTTDMIAKGKVESEKLMQAQITATSAAKAILGFNGRMISHSKSSYTDKHPENVVVFNGNVCTSKGKIWYGDIDVTLDESNLKKLATTIGENVYVLKEMDARFEHEAKPLLDKAVVVARSNGDVALSTYISRSSKDKTKGKIVVGKA